MFRISILMCGARNGGSVMSTRLWCSYMVESAVEHAEKGLEKALRRDAREVVWSESALRCGALMGIP